MRNIMLANKRSPLALIAVLLLARVDYAAAEPRMNNLPGTVCQSSDSIPTYVPEGIGNDTSQTMHLACPLSLTVRNITDFSTTNTALLAASGGNGCPSTGDLPAVTFLDRSSSADISCTLNVLDSGNVIQSSFTVTSSGSSINAQRKTWAVPTRMDLTGKHLYVECDVPPLDPTGGRSLIEGFSIATCDP
jgi:hypothetical protein